MGVHDNRFGDNSVLCDNDNLLGYWYPVARAVDVMGEIGRAHV